jgi:glycosyltransferase involved in cell wall biosynthesis
MKKLLFILPSMRGGGAERVILNLCQALDKTKFTILLALVQKEGPYIDLIPADIQIVDLYSRRLRYALLSIINLIKKEKPDIVFSTLTHQNIALCFLKPFFINIRLIIRESNIVSLILEKARDKILYFLFIGRADMIICQSDDMLHDLVKNFNCNIKKMYKINNPVNFNFLEEKIREPLDFSFEPNRKILLAAGRLEYQKGFDLLIDTFSQLPNKEEFQLILLGIGSMKAKLEEQSRKRNVEHLVYFAGFVDNPYKYMSKADFFISSSRFEGFPNAVIEALACGTPVIANAYLGGIHEIINERVGSIIDITNPALLQNALLKNYDSDEIKAYCKAKYSLDGIIKQYETIFDRCEETTGLGVALAG